MFKIHVTLFLLIALCSVLNARAGENAYQPIKGKALRTVFSNTMMVGEYRTSRAETQTYEYTEYHFKNGTSDYKEGSLSDAGIWTLVGDDKICYKYPKSSTYTRTYCFFVYENNGCYYKYSPYSMGLKGPKSWELWSSRAIRKGSGASCAAAVS